MSAPRRIGRDSLTNLIHQLDAHAEGEVAPDSVPTGFASLDKVLGGGFRRRDLIILGGDVGSGKSCLALGIALRSAAAGHKVAFFSGEMDEDRLMERALAMEARVTVDEIRIAELSDAGRAAMGAAAVRLRDLPLVVYPLVGGEFDETLEMAWNDDPPLVVVDYLQLVLPPAARPRALNIFMMTLASLVYVGFALWTLGIEFGILSR